MHEGVVLWFFRLYLLTKKRVQIFILMRTSLQKLILPLLAKNWLEGSGLLVISLEKYLGRGNPSVYEIRLAEMDGNDTSALTDGQDSSEEGVERAGRPDLRKRKRSGAHRRQLAERKKPRPLPVNQRARGGCLACHVSS